MGYIFLMESSRGISTLPALAAGCASPTLRKVKKEGNMRDTLATTHNGWCNRETWVVNLWITNERYADDVLRHIIKAFETLGEQAEELEYWVRLDFEMQGESSMWSDLLSTSLGRVNWYEIVENNQ
jgi:hypothetical protein